MSKSKEKRLNRKEMISTINTYCEKTGNKETLKCLMKVSELFYKMQSDQDEEVPEDIDIDLALLLFRLLDCRNENVIRRIYLIAKTMTS